MSQIILFVIFISVISIEASTLRWEGYNDDNWWNPFNWQCDRDYCVPSAGDDVIFDPTDCTFCVRHVVLGIQQAQIRSLVIKSTPDFKFILDILSGIGLVVGSGGITTDKDSTIYLYGKLWSVGNVVTEGDFLLQSGEIYGPGNYSFYHLMASSCNLYSHVTVMTDLDVEPQAPGLADTILIQPNGSLTVIGNLITDNPIIISGKLNITKSAIFLSRNETFRYSLTGNIPQTFGGISVPSGLLIVTIPFTTQNLFVGQSANVQINYDSIIGNASGSGLVSIENGNIKLEVTDPKLQIISVGNLAIIGNSVGTVVVNGGGLTTDLKGGNIFNIQNLTVVRGFIQLSPFSVVNQLFLGEGVIVQGSLNVSNKAVSVGTFSIFHSVVVIEKGATFEQNIGNFQIFGHPDDNYPVFVNDGLYLLKGSLQTHAFIGGNGVWNIDGSWLVGLECKITGIVNLIGNTTITFENFYYHYDFGMIRNGGFYSNVGFFTAKDVSVDWVSEQFSESYIDSVTTTKYYISRCCGPKKIGSLTTDLLDLETGNYPFTIGKGIINTLKLLDGVSLGFNQSADINNFQFIGGSLLSDNNVKVTVRNTTYLVGNSQKIVSGATLDTIILDCTQCLTPTCNLDGWGNIKAATTRGRCANQLNLLG